MLNKSFLENFFLIGSFLYLISAINNPLIGSDFTSFFKIISFFRAIAPYILLPVLILYLFFIKRNIKFEWIYLLFFLYILGLFIGYLFNPLGFPYHINTQNQIYWLICNSTVFLYFYIIRDNKDFNILILKIFIFVVAIITIKFLFNVYLEFFLEIHNRERVINFFYNLYSMAPHNLFMDQPVPRSSGLSRMTILLLLFLYIQLFFLKNGKNKTIIYFIIIGFLIFTIFNLQNRVSVFYILVLFLFTIFFKIHIFSFKKRIIYSICIFLIPFVMHLNIQQVTLKVIKIYKGDNVEISEEVNNIEGLSEYEKSKIKEENDLKKTQIENNKAINTLKKQRLLLKSSTGRTELWNRSLNLFFINKFIGYGVQADRVILGENASSLYFYAMLCGGVVSIFSIILITLILFFKSIKMIFINNIFSTTEMYTCFALLFIGYLYLRSVVEISFGIFGIDMILFFLFFNILRNSKSY